MTGYPAVGTQRVSEDMDAFQRPCGSCFVVLRHVRNLPAIFIIHKIDSSGSMLSYSVSFLLVVYCLEAKRCHGRGQRFLPARHLGY